MRSSYHQVDDVVVLTIAGAIDTHAAAVEFEYLLAHVPGAGHLVLDLAEVTALGTTGLTVLARAAPGDEHVVIGERHDVVLRAGDRWCSGRGTLLHPLLIGEDRTDVVPT
jgi:ABC-type transporter Mla MlaB component